MCRLVAYYGPPLRLSSVLTEAAHGLVHQSYAPREMTVGILNADGWGIGWFTRDPGSKPGLLKGTLPIWSDENATAVPHAVASGSFLAVVRSASPGLGVAMTNTPPYARGDSLFAHNGQIWPWPGLMARTFRDRVSPEDEAEVRGVTDSEWLLALWQTHRRRRLDQDNGEALVSALLEVRGLSTRQGGGVSANLVLATASGFNAIRFADPGPAPSLYLLREEPRWSGGTLIASEPLDDQPGWQEIPPSTHVRVDDHGLSRASLPR